MIGGACSMKDHRNAPQEDMVLLEKTLKVFLKENRKEIEIDASFVYKEDTFEGPKGKSDLDNKMLLGQWEIDCHQNACTAHIKKRYGKPPSGWKTEEIEVIIDISENKYSVIKWDAFQSWGN